VKGTGGSGQAPVKKRNGKIAADVVRRESQGGEMLMGRSSNNKDIKRLGNALGFMECNVVE
jgi:hypothetical protein